MADILIRGVKAQTIKNLKARAKRNGRSLQSEVRTMLESAAGSEEIVSVFAGWRKRLGQSFSDSAELIREDRER